MAVPSEDRPTSSREHPITVGEVVRLAGRVVDGLGLLWLEGEVTQVSQPTSGHLYFALRDAGAVLPAVMWGRDTARIRFRIEAGQRLRVRGRAVLVASSVVKRRSHSSVRGGAGPVPDL